VFVIGGLCHTAYVIVGSVIGIFKVIDCVEALIAKLNESELFGEMSLVVVTRSSLTINSKSRPKWQYRKSA